MRSHKAMVFILMLICSLGVFSISTLLLSNPDTKCIDEPVRQFGLAYTPHDVIWIQNNQELIDQADAESWPGEGTAESPYVISGFSFDQDTQPVRIWNTDLYWIFTGNLIDSDLTGQQCGTWIDNVKNGVISGNVIRHRHAGMYVLNVENFNITDNEIHDNLGYGMEFGGWIKSCNVSGNTLYNCPTGGIRIPAGTFNSTIIGNTVSDSAMGINLLGAVHNSSISRNSIENVAGQGIGLAMITNTIVSFNSVANASDESIAIYGSTISQVVNNTITNSQDDGLVLSFCDESLVQYNTIIGSENVGILATSGAYSSILWNTIENSLGYGIELRVDTEYFEVKYNTFENNGVTCQICDHGMSNEISFNYYSDWTNPDDDSNGIVDNPYVADGDANNEDPYPLVVEGVVPSIEEPTTSTTTPTNPEEPVQIPMNLILVGAAVIAIVIISGAMLLKKR
ncbi:MAG: nitrous oxide reductase family maturation protein NosD [Candidatus Thorarchaeota archaeon]